MQVKLRYFAAAGAAAGTDSETIEAPEGATVADLIFEINRKHVDSSSAAQLEKVLSISSFLVNGRRADVDSELPADSEVDVLPPFAGG